MASNALIALYPVLAHLAIGAQLGVGSRNVRLERVKVERSADGYYHPEDEVYLPWFMRLAPNLISEPTQSVSAKVGRYSLMGDLNPFPGFRQPATGRV